LLRAIAASVSVWGRAAAAYSVAFGTPHIDPRLPAGRAKVNEAVRDGLRLGPAAPVATITTLDDDFRTPT